MSQENSLNKQQIADYLRKNPDFFRDNADLFEVIKPPEADHGGNVVDLQYYILERLQNGLKSMKQKYDGLLVSGRDNMSTLHQVHEAVLLLLRAGSFDQFLEITTFDLPALFNVDTVKFCIESDAAEFYAGKFEEEDTASGIGFLEVGTVDKIMGKDKSIVLISDTGKQFLYGFEQIFSDCSGIIESAAILRMSLPSSQRPCLLAFGVRIPGHFYDGQGTEMLSFFAQVFEHLFDLSFNDSGIADFI